MFAFKNPNLAQSLKNCAGPYGRTVAPFRKSAATRSLVGKVFSGRHTHGLNLLVLVHWERVIGGNEIVANILRLKIRLWTVLFAKTNIYSSGILSTSLQF